MSNLELDSMEITDVDDKLLDELLKGRCTQGYLVDVTDIPRYKVHERLKLFEAAGVAQNLHPPTALWELVDDPREDSSESEDDS